MQLRMSRTRKPARVPSPTVHYARNLVSELLAGKRTAVDAVQALKELGDLAATRFFFERVGHIPAIRRTMLGPARVSTFAEFGKAPNPTGPVGPLAVELLLAALTLSFKAEAIADFVARQLAFERALVRGDLDEATRGLAEIEGYHGKSLWLIESENLAKVMRFGAVDAVDAVDADAQRLVVEAHGNVHLLLAVCALFVRRVHSGGPKGTNRAFIRQIAKTFTNVPQDTLDWWILRNSPAALVPGDDEQLASFLREASCLPVVDRYVALRRTIMTAAAAQNSIEVRQGLAAATAVLARFVSDPWIAVVRGQLGEKSPTANDAASELLNCLDLYTAGDYLACVAAARQAIDNDPLRVDFHELYVRASIRAGGQWEPIGAPGSILRDVSDTLQTYWRWSDGALDAIKALETKVILLAGLQLGERLVRLLPSSSALRSETSEHFHLIASPCPTPRLPLGFGDARAARGLLRRLRARCDASITLDAFAAVLLPDELVGSAVAAVPPGRMARLRALAALADGRHADAYMQLEGVTAADESIVDSEEITAMQMQAYLGLDWIEECVSLIARVYVEHPAMLLNMPLAGVFDRLSPERLAAFPGIDVPLVLLAIQVYSSPSVESYQIYVAVDEYLASRGCQRPTQLRRHYGDVTAEPGEDLPKLVEFLRGACATHIMDHSPVFTSQQDLENERIEVCAWLGELDPVRKPEYDDEQVRLVKAQTIRQAIRRVERSKVYVDIGGIRRANANKLIDDFAKLQELSRVEGRLRRLAAQGDSVVLVKARAGLVVPLFLDVFRRMTHEFLRSDAHGLDANLSIRIRHGTLIGQMRGHFERSRLVTARDSRRDEYERNDYWLEGDSIPAELHERMDARLQQFSRAIDRTIEVVKDEWLQIRTEERLGVFDYRFNPTELSELVRKAVVAKDVEEFGDLIFQTLWQRTEQNADRAKLKIQEELHATFVEHLNALEADLLRMDAGIRRTRLRSAIERCRGTLQPTLESIAGWFDVDAARPASDYRFDLLADTCVALIRRRLPSARAKRITSLVAGELPLLRGHLFEHLFALVHILLDNAIRHGLPDVEVSLVIGEDDDAVTFRVSNGVTPEQATDLAKRLADLEQRTRFEGPTSEIHREGGTGFFKLGKIIRVDLKTEDYTVRLAIEDGRMSTSVRIAAGELLA